MEYLQHDRDSNVFPTPASAQESVNLRIWAINQTQSCITPRNTACSVHISLCGLAWKLITFHRAAVCLQTDREYLSPAGGPRPAENSKEARVQCKRNKRCIERCCVCQSSSVDSSHSNLKAALCFTDSNHTLLSFSLASGIYSLHKGLLHKHQNK